MVGSAEDSRTDDFDAATLEAMSKAFDQVRARLGTRTDLPLHKVAASILAHARKGERDSERLYQSACAELGVHE